MNLIEENDMIDEKKDLLLKDCFEKFQEIENMEGQN